MVTGSWVSKSAFWAHSWGRAPLCSQNYTTDHQCSKSKKENHSAPELGREAIGEGQQEDVMASLTHKLNLGNWRHPIPFPVLGMCIPLALPAPRSCPKNTSLR